MGNRVTGKNGAIYGVSSRTAVIIAVSMTDFGDHKTFTLTGFPLWDSTHYPTILVDGSAPSVAFTVNYIAGSITFASSIGTGHTVTINNITYSTLVLVGDFTDWSVDAMIDVVDATAMGDTWHQKVTTFLGWTATVEHFYVSSYFWTAFVTGNTFYVKFFIDGAGTTCWLGNGFFQWGVSVPFDGAIKEAISFEGTDQLQFTA